MNIYPWGSVTFNVEPVSVCLCRSWTVYNADKRSDASCRRTRWISFPAARYESLHSSRQVSLKNPPAPADVAESSLAPHLKAQSSFSAPSLFCCRYRQVRCVPTFVSDDLPPPQRKGVLGPNQQSWLRQQTCTSPRRQTEQLRPCMLRVVWANANRLAMEITWFAF